MLSKIIRKLPLICAVSACLSAQTGVENLVNSRIVVKNTSILYDAAEKSAGRQTSQNVNRVSWSPSGKTLLLDLQGINQYYNVAKAKLDGTAMSVSVLTARKNQYSSRLHNSNPAWHPSGKYFVFTAQNTSANEFNRAMPDSGLFSNLWIGDKDGSSFHQLTREISSINAPRGMVMPSFSPDGNKLFWTECQGAALNSIVWERCLKLGDFSMANGTPVLSNIRTVQPSAGEFKFSESYGFSPDEQKLLFAANTDKKQEWFGMDICTMDAETFAVEKLTDTPGVWDRFAAFSPSGSKILWSSSEGYTIPYLGPGGTQWKQSMMSELWIMNRDGSDKRRLTSFNERGSSQYTGKRSYIGTIAWNPDGRRVALVLHSQYNVYGTSSSVVLLELGNSQGD